MKAKSHFLPNQNLAAAILGDPSDPPRSSVAGTKVVATIGPSSQNVVTLVDMLDAGLDAARVDLTWGSLDYHLVSLRNLQAASRLTRKICCVLVDTRGREMLINRPFVDNGDGWPVFSEEPYEIEAGQTITLSGRPDAVASPTILPVAYPKFASMVQKGDSLYIGRYLVSGQDQASLYLEIKDIVDSDIVCEAQNSAVLDGLLTVFHSERSTTSLINAQNDLPILTEEDQDNLKTISKEFEIDYVCLSFTRTADDVREARYFLNSIGMENTKLVAKIETRMGLLNLKGILSEADAILVSRGNLGLDCPSEKMAMVQKTLINVCNLMGTPVLLTRLVDTMVTVPRPTRAEATDVANAVLDGVDGFVLGAETLRGHHPVLTIRTIKGICHAAESVFDHSHHFDFLMEEALQLQHQTWGESDDEGDATAYSMQDPDMVPGSHDLVPHMILNGTNGLHGNGYGNGYNSSGKGSSGTSTPQLPPPPLARQATTLRAAVRAMTKYAANPSMQQLAGLNKNHGSSSTLRSIGGSPWQSKLEAIASSAVRAAEKTAASLIVVFTHTGQTAQLVAKYRPPMPILVLVVPHLQSDGLSWKLVGRTNARQCNIVRGLLPMLANPSPNGEEILLEAIVAAGAKNLVKPNSHVVCIERVHGHFCLKVVTLDATGKGIVQRNGLERLSSNLVGAV